ncbi:MAG: transglutaminase-like cysteine peptidase [Beijerinckiaceae bacterium]|nr:transglutaminase-like cysteine peptidase [Beijerinckiaceae bacterium]
MFAKVARFITTAIAIASVTVTLQAPAQAQALKATYINVGDRTLVPYGWLEFCNRYQGECVGTDAAAHIELTPANYRRISQVNRWVNSTIVAKSDQEQWGVVDRWDYPSTGQGDCEDYVLMKRRLLIEEGFPRSALLVTVVRDQRGDGHAVLTVKTSKGEFVLDNLREGVKPWSESPYRFVKRQSQQDQNVWVDIGDFATGPRVAAR